MTTNQIVTDVATVMPEDFANREDAGLDLSVGIAKVQELIAGGVDCGTVTNMTRPTTTETEDIYSAPSIQSLPNDVLKKIFSYLDVPQRLRIEAVCRKWRLIGKLLPWTNPLELIFTQEAQRSSLELPSIALTDAILISLLSRCGSCLLKIKLSYGCNNWVPVTHKAILAISRYCPNVESITLHGVPEATSDFLNMIAVGCQKLKEFHYAQFAENHNYEDGVLAVVRKCEALESLAVSGVTLSKKLFDVASSRLCQINLVKCHGASNALENLMKNSQVHLSKLTLYFFDSSLMEAGEATWFATLQHFKETLQTLVVCQVGMPANINWCLGLKNLHNLEELTLRFYHSINDDLVDVLVKECSKLRILELPASSVTDLGLAILSSLPHLKQLDISQNRYVSGNGLAPLVHCNTLEVLRVGCNPNVTEEFCCSLAKLCPNLIILDVSGSKHMTNRLVSTFKESAESGVRKEPITLVVGCTSVKANVRKSDKVFVDYSCPWLLPVVKKTILKLL